MVIYERQARFNQQTADEMVKNLLAACSAVGEYLYFCPFCNCFFIVVLGIPVKEKDPIIRWESAQGRIMEVSVLHIV